MVWLLAVEDGGVLPANSPTAQHTAQHVAIANLFLHT